MESYSRGLIVNHARFGQKAGAVLGVGDLDSNGIAQFRLAAATMSRAANQHAGNRPDI